MRRHDDHMAADAFGWVERTLPTLSQKQHGEFRSAARGLPSFLRRSGLAASMATILAKRGVELKIAEELCRYVGTEPIGLMKEATTVTGPDYLVRQRQIVAYAVWVKKAAEALIDAPEIGDAQASEVAGDDTGTPTGQGTS